MTALAVALLLLAAGDILVTVFLVRAARRLREPALEERATVSVILTFVAGLWAIAAAAYLANVQLGEGVSAVLVIAVSALVSVPQFVWAVAYRTGRFR